MKEQILKTLETSGKYTLKVAGTMPDSGYSFKPEGTGWDFAELLAHIGYGMYWWTDNFILARPTEWNQPEDKRNKADIMNYLKEAYTYVEESIKSVSLNDDSIHGFFATIDHITHHRGQAVIFLRCQNIVPPEYTF